MTTGTSIPPVRLLPEDLANKIAAGEVVERPASVVKELVENAIDARATRISVRLVAAGRRTIEVVDNGHGMSEQDALLAIERHATSKIRKPEDLEGIRTMGFRGEALPSIAAVSRFEMVTRRAKDESATRIRIDGGVLRDVSQVAAPPGTRVAVNHLYFNTPVRAKFLKGITTELSHAIDIVQRHSLSEAGVGFQLYHNEKTLLDIPERAALRERVALIWGLNFVKDMLPVEGEKAGFRVHGLVGMPNLTRSQRSHQFFFMNKRPVMNRSLQYGFEDGYRGLLTIGRYPVGILMVETHPRFVDVNIHPSKREIRFRDERAAHDAIREIIREQLSAITAAEEAPPIPFRAPSPPVDAPLGAPVGGEVRVVTPVVERVGGGDTVSALQEELPGTDVFEVSEDSEACDSQDHVPMEDRATLGRATVDRVAPAPMYRPMGHVDNAPMQLFDTYLLVPEDERLLIIDQHALHERLTYDVLVAELEDHQYASQQLAVPILVDVPPSHVRLLETNLKRLAELGIEIEPFGGNTFQIVGVCHLYDESKVPDVVYRLLDAMAQGDLFDSKAFLADFLRLAVEACRGSVKAGDRLTSEERRALLDGFRRLRPPYTCPHGRPIVTELTLNQMEKSFRRKQ